MHVQNVVYDPGKSAADTPQQEGFYQVFIGERPAVAPSDVECPYCRALMSECRDVTTSARVMRERFRADTGIVCDVEFVPSTHRLFICKPCRQVFTSLKEMEIGQ